MWTANKRMPLGVPRVGEGLKGGRMKNKTEKENPQHKRSKSYLPRARSREAADRIGFRRFLGYPESIPDATTVWLFREHLAESGRDKAVWAELQRQLDEKGLTVKKGVAQDASFITADPGGLGPRGDEAETRRSQDRSWAKKGGNPSFGYKLHMKEDTDLGLVRGLEVTTASVYDSRVDLSLPVEVVYRDARWPVPKMVLNGLYSHSRIQRHFRAC